MLVVVDRIESSTERDFDMAYKSTNLTYQREVGSGVPEICAIFPHGFKLKVEAVESMDADDLEETLATLQAEYME